MSPFEAKLPYITRNDKNELCLNKNHKYFTQIQLQMVASKCKQCYMYIWKPVDAFMELVTLDTQLWEIELRHLFSDFYINHYVPYLFDHNKDD